MRLARVLAGIGVAATLAASCGGRTAPPPEPGTTRGFPRDLRGRRVMVLPVQQNLGVRGNPDAEIRFSFEDLGRGVDWVFPDEVEAALARSPGFEARTHGLNVGMFVMGEVERVGDPLYGQLLRMSALVIADIALIPVQMSEALGEGATEPTVRTWTTLLDIRSGRVIVAVRRTKLSPES